MNAFCTGGSSVLSKELEALGIHGSFPGLPPQPGSGPAFPLYPCSPVALGGQKISGLFVSAASWALFSWVCSWPFTQVTHTCFLFVSTCLHSPPCLLRGSHSNVFPEPHPFPFTHLRGSWPGAGKAPSLIVKNCTHQEPALQLSIPRGLPGDSI